jgi:hypothetical protein
MPNLHRHNSQIHHRAQSSQILSHVSEKQRWAIRKDVAEGPTLEGAVSLTKARITRIRGGTGEVVAKPDGAIFGEDDLVYIAFDHPGFYLPFDIDGSLREISQWVVRT